MPQIRGGKGERVILGSTIITSEDFPLFYPPITSQLTHVWQGPDSKAQPFGAWNNEE
jgi:hypothetical protein